MRNSMLVLGNTGDNLRSYHARKVSPLLRRTHVGTVSNTLVWFLQTSTLEHFILFCTINLIRSIGAAAVFDVTAATPLNAKFYKEQS
eukprot:TRINITY_DN3931_c0_g1_i1.p1 TRINITY_DN3931_c0_g1~~TRINITY_DN3931_c0_g1_i1.p1  ORF type:complete len:87 (+),score=3.91 TRINITY_DN3931_c0_g1_i1:178-438(+)